MFRLDYQFLQSLFSHKAVLRLREEVPTHTEDGIPIRKLFVSNLPNYTTRFELMEIFRQYGWIKSCWLRMEDKRPNAPPTAIYAFITFANPEDAHNALKAPNHEMMLRGRFLKIKPADSWHQPNDNAIKNNSNADGAQASTSSPNEDTSSLLDPEDVQSGEEFNFTDRLNGDCIMHIFSYIPLPEILKIQRVCKSWKNAIEDYISGIRTLKTSDCDTHERHLTTAMLRCVLFHIGPQLTKLHLDQDSFMLNDRAVQAIGKHCPNLVDLRLYGILGSTFSAIFFGCKELKSLYFDTCPLLSDKSFIALCKRALPLEELKISSSPEVIGTFLNNLQFIKLKNLALKNCFQLQPSHLISKMKYLENLTSLQLDEISPTIWSMLPTLLKNITKLEKLSLATYPRTNNDTYERDFFAFLDLCSNLKELRFARNFYITNAILEHIGKNCTQLRSLDISACNSELDCPDDKGIKHILASCKELQVLNISYLKYMSNATLNGLVKLPQLKVLLLRGNIEITPTPFPEVFKRCSALELVDVCGCENIDGDIIEHAVTALERSPHSLKLLVSTSGAADYNGSRKHHLLKVDNSNNTCNPLYMPNYQLPVMFPELEDSEDDDTESYDFDENNFYDFSDADDFTHSDSDEWEIANGFVLP